MSNFLLCSQLAHTNAYNVPDTEIAALQDLYDATNGTFWNWHGEGTKWNFTEANPCVDAWQGVNCSQVTADGFLHVTELVLYEYNLEGTIPPSIAQLTQLVTLLLRSNELSGTIPGSAGHVTVLTELHRNNLTGGTPASLGQLKHLMVLDLGDNRLSGTIPTFVGELIQLTLLTLLGNFLSGTVPASLHQLTQLTQLSLYENHLTGTVPALLSKLKELTVLELDANKLSGTIPNSFQQLSGLSGLCLQFNQLTGTVPDSLSQLSKLQKLYLDTNQLNGTIPASLGRLVLLTGLDMDTNLLSGTIPDALKQLTHLSQLYLNNNQLTGTIPISLATLVQLRALHVGTNLLTGRISDSLSQLTLLELLYMQNNHFTGTIPPSLGQLARLKAVSLGGNDLHGSIPQIWAAATGTIQVLHLNGNRFRGPIPGSLGHLPQLLSLNLSSNRLTGTIPASLQQLGSLQVLLLHNNQLRGNVTELFSPAQQRNLSTVQLSGNQLTGTLPAAAFLLPSLSSFAAVGNCFEGPLPEEAICSSISLNALVLDGLHSASSCRNSVSLYREGFKLGPLPQCMLSMLNLNTLHLSGNGLTGSLRADTFNISAALRDLSLSHNLLTGSIPDSVLGEDWNKLDLSYNRLTGTLHSASAAPYSNTSVLYLLHNRLSGAIPGSMQRVHSLSLLENNMFSCRVDRSDVPQQAADSDKYTCGSDAVNNPLYAWLGATVAVVAASGVMVVRKPGKQVVKCWYAAACGEKPCMLQRLLAAASTLRDLGSGSASYCILILLPMYAAVNSYHPSFIYKYAWTVSGVYLAGAAAFTVETVFLLLQLLVCAYATERLLSRRDTPSYCEVGAAGAVQGSTTGCTQRTGSNVAVMLFSLAVVTGFNTAFVFATLRLSGRELTVIQILLAAFKLGFNSFAAPALRNRVRALGAGHEVTASQLMLVLVNVVVIPCLVVMAISPACFYDALTGSVPVTSSYQYGGSCQMFVVGATPGTSSNLTITCIGAGTQRELTSYTPPFTYSYQCSSSFVTSYAPTFVIMCIISGFVVPAYHAVLLWLRRHLSPTSRLYSVLTAATPRILRELQSPQDLAQARSDPLYRPVFDANKVVMSLLTYLALLLTFGALFPPLAVCCAVAMASVVLTARLEVGRYMSAAVAADRQDCLDEVESACAGVATPQQLRMALYLVLAVSCLFYTLFLFDTLGYEVGFAGAFWVLIVVPLLPVVAWALHVVAIRVRGSGIEANKPAPTARDPEAVVELAGMHTAKDNSGVVDTFSASPMHMP
jgi:Leucine-rich repeat (LRR) protein